MLQWTSLYITKCCRLLPPSSLKFILKTGVIASLCGMKLFQASELVSRGSRQSPNQCLLPDAMFAPSETCGQQPSEHALCWVLYGKCCWQGLCLSPSKQTEPSSTCRVTMLAALWTYTSLCVQNRKCVLSVGQDDKRATSLDFFKKYILITVDVQYSTRFRCITQWLNIYILSGHPVIMCQAWKAPRTTTNQKQ